MGGDKDRSATRHLVQKAGCSIGVVRQFVRRAIGITRRWECCGLVRAGNEQGVRRSAGGGLPLLLGFSGDRSLEGSTRGGKSRRGWNDFGDGRFRFREQIRDRIDNRADNFGGRQRGGLQGFMVIEHPSGEHRFGCLLDPLIDQGGNFLPQIRGVVEPRQFKTLQRSAGSRLQIVERRSETRYGHGQSSNLRAGPRGPATEIISAQY